MKVSLVTTSALCLLFLSAVPMASGKTNKKSAGKKKKSSKKKKKNSKKSQKKCFSFEYVSTANEASTELPPSPGSHIVTKVTLADEGSKRVGGIKATFAFIDFTIIQMTAIIPEFGLPAFANSTCQMVVNYDDDSILTLSGSEVASVLTLEANQKWAVTGGTGAMVGATGEGYGSCVPAGGFETQCEYGGKICL